MRCDDEDGDVEMWKEMEEKKNEAEKAVAQAEAAAAGKKDGSVAISA